MNRFVRNLVRGCLLLFIAGAGIASLQAQSSVFDPNDNVVVYNRNNPPTEPPFGQPGKWVKTTRVSWNTSSFKAYIYKGVQFRLKWPKNYDASGNTKYPLYVFFHGRGEWGSRYDNDYQLYHGGELHKNAVDNGQFNGFLLYPQASVMRGPWSAEERQFVMELIENFLIPQVYVDPFRISVDGLSAGGLASWNSLKEYPKLIAACLPISNAASIFSNIVIDNKFTPIWLFQGALDTDPKPIASQNLKAVADNAGANFTYTEYPNLGHGSWYAAWGEPDYFPFLNRANKANPWPLYGRTEFCNTGAGSINTIIGVTAGFNEYQWRKNDELLTGLGTTSNTLTVTDIGVYSCRIRKGTTWSEWSPIPVEIKYKTSTVPPLISVSGLASRVLPAPDGKTTVSLEVPANYSIYNWQKVGNPPNTPPLSSTNVLDGATPGDYEVQVTEQFGCSSAFTAPFKVINADGPNKPDPATGLIIIPLSYTSLKLNWSSNPNPVYPQTNFEIYQATKAGGPYQFVSLVNGNIFSFVKEGLTPGVKYYYIVRAINNTAAAPVSNEASATTQKDTDPPTAPANLHVTGTSRNYVALGWEGSTDDVGMDHYEIYVNGIKSYVTSETEYTVYGLEYGKSYNFTVKAVDIAGNKSAPSNQVTAQPLAKGLSFKHYTGTWDNLPDFNLLTPISTGIVPNVTLANASQAENYAFLWEGFIHIPTTGYYVFSSTSDDGSKVYLDLNSSHTSSPYSHTATAQVNNDGLHGTQTVNSSRISLSAGVYPIAITFFQKGGGAVMGISWSRVSQNGNTTFFSGTVPDSAFVDAPLPSAGNAPAKPSNLTATAVSFKSINLTWGDNSNNETSFELYRSTDPLDGFITIGVLPANTTSFADTLAEPSTTYYYKIRAINQYGESPFDKIGPGVEYAYYERTGMTVVPDFNIMTPIKTGRVNTIGLGMQMRENNFALKFDGYINITTGGNYTFYLNSDDGSRLYIDDDLVVDYDGLHGAAGDVPGQINLSAGTHAIRVTFFEATGSEVLIVKYQGPGVVKQDIPANVLGDILAHATTLAAPPAPEAPGNLIAVATTSTVIKTRWTNTAANATGVDLYRSYNGNEDYVLLAQLPPNAGAYSDTALYPGSLFYYKVRAVGEGGNSAYSNEASARTRGVIPSVLPIENVYMRFGSTVELPVEARAVSPVNITLQVENLPSFASFQQTANGKGTIIFTPALENEGIYPNITVVASNPQNDITKAKFTLTVNSNYVPVLSSIADVTVNEMQNMQVQLFAADQDTEDFLIWNFSGLPSFATVSAANNQAATVKLAPKYGDAGVYTVKASIKDGRNSKDTASFKITVLPTDAPSNPNDGTIPVKPKDIVVQFESTTDAVKVSWTNMAYNATGFEIYRSSSLTGYYTVLNPGADNKDSTSYHDYTATGNNTYFYVVRAVNMNGGSNSEIIKLITPNRAPVITADDVYIKSGNTADINVTATDDPGDIITLAAPNLPPFATFTDNGNGNATIHLSPTGAHVGTFDLSVRASDHYGATAVKTVKIIVTDKYISSVFVNFNNKDYPVSIRPWNSFNAVQVGDAQVAKNTKISNLKEETGGVTTMSVELLESWPQHYVGVVTGNNSGIYPDSIMMSGYYFYTKSSVPQKTIRISGLNNDNNKRYNLVFFGNRSYTSAQVTYFTAGGQTVSLNATGNTTNTVQINNLLPTDGTIDVVVKANTDKYAVINAMVIQEYDDQVFLPPFNLGMVKSTRNSISLSWECSATNVTAFEVWRSDAPNGTYVKLPATIPGNVFTYTNGGLDAGTIYYYKVRAVSGTSYSEYSDYVSAATISYAIDINFNDGFAGPAEPAPWNNINELITPGFTMNNLLNQDNQHTGIGMTVVNNFGGFNTNGPTTGNNSGVVPDNVMRSYYYMEYGVIARLRITGLNQAMRYNFVFFGSRLNNNIGQTTSYTIGQETVLLNGKDNTTTTVQINNVQPDATGNVEIVITSALVGGNGYLNSLTIQSVPIIPGSGSGSSSSGRSSLLPLSAQASSPVLSPASAELQQSDNATLISAYPNPFVQDIMLNISLKKASSKLVVILKDFSGRTIFTTNLANVPAGKSQHRLDINGSRLSPGVYGIQVINPSDGESRTIKVIRN